VTVGEALAEARYRAGLTVDEVSDRTRIREAVIRGIEQDDYEACGGDLYVHGYVRAIAGAIGIDAQPLIREYDLRQAEAPEALETPETPETPEAADTSEAADTPGAPAAGAAPDAPAAAAAPAAAESAAPAENPARGRTQRRVAAIAVLALAVAGAAGGLIASGLDHHAQAKNTTASAPTLQRTPDSAGAQQGTGSKAAPGAAKPAAAPTPTKPKPVKAQPKTPPVAAAARIRALPIKLAEAFGADGLVDGDNPQIAMYAITRGAPLPWESQWYVTPEFGMLKTGTGLLLDMGRRVTVTSVRIQLGAYAGADLQLRVGNSAAALSSLKVVTRANGVGGAVRFRLRSPRTARYVLLWFTLLPPNGVGQYQVSVSRAVVNGRP
jgi:transcriptional regulator with XRE-family HTH domain